MKTIMLALATTIFVISIPMILWDPSMPNTQNYPACGINLSNPIAKNSQPAINAHTGNVHSGTIISHVQTATAFFKLPENLAAAVSRQSVHHDGFMPTAGRMPAMRGTIDCKGTTKPCLFNIKILCPQNETDVTKQ